jgi:hypothetical protein
MSDKISDVLSTDPILTAEQREQLAGFGSILPTVEVFELGWRTAMSYARDALAQAQDKHEQDQG